MLLAVDVGNTQTALGLYRGAELRDHWRLATERSSTADELGVLLGGLLDLDEVDGICLSSTVPILVREWELLARKWAHASLLVVGPGVKTGIAIRYDDPREVGPDRIANSVAAKARYGAPVIDLGHWFMDSDLTAVVGVLRNFIPERIAASTGAMARFNIDDGDIFIGEFASGAICSVQSSFVTVGNYPGIEVRVYGSEGAAIARLVEERGICETLHVAWPDEVEFREIEIPAGYYPPGGHPREQPAP